jgi:hypothetical protein
MPERNEKRIHVALPVRVTYFDEDNKPRMEMACTYDISVHGARVTGLRSVKEPGEIVVVERGRNKAFCRVVWIGEPGTPLQQQAGIQCVEAHRALWEVEMRDMQEMYDPMTRDQVRYRALPGNYGERSRRRYHRFDTEGVAQLLRKGADASYLEGKIKDLSETGCLIETNANIIPGTDLKLVLRFANCDMSFKGMVRHAAAGVGLGIEFREIRKGDRAVLQYVLRKLAEKELGNRPAKAAKAAVR